VKKDGEKRTDYRQSRDQVYTVACLN